MSQIRLRLTQFDASSQPAYESLTHDVAQQRCLVRDTSRSATVRRVNADSARYARITHRLALGVSSEDDEASQALAELLERRIVESIAIECAPHVTSDLMSERLAQAVAALREHDIALRLQRWRHRRRGLFL